MAETSEITLIVDITGDEEVKSKLKALQGFVEQVRKRGEVLNKIRISPVVTINDRISAPLQTIQENLDRISSKKINLTGTIDFQSIDISSTIKSWLESSGLNSLSEVGKEIGKEILKGINISVSEGMNNLFENRSNVQQGEGANKPDNGSPLIDIGKDILIGIITNFLYDKIKTPLEKGSRNFRDLYQFGRKSGFGPARAATQAADFLGANAPGWRGQLYRGARFLFGRAALPITIGSELLNIATAENRPKAATEAAGGISGMVLGAETGAILGSFIPGVGNVVGGIVGGAIGYFGGKRLGSGIYNWLTGKTEGNNTINTEATALMSQNTATRTAIDGSLQTTTTDVIAKMGSWAEQAWNITAISTAFAFNLQNLANNVIATGTNLSIALENLKYKVSYLAESNLGFNFQPSIPDLSGGNVSNLALAGTNGQNINLSVGQVSVNIDRGMDFDEHAQLIGYKIVNEYKGCIENMA